MAPQPRQPDKRGCTDACAVQENTRLVRVDLQTGLFSTVFETLYGICHFRLNPTCDALAYEDGNGRLILRSLADGSETGLYTPVSPAIALDQPGREGVRRFAVVPWSWSPDGGYVLSLTPGAFDSAPGLLQVPVGGGDARVLAPAWDATWGSGGLGAGDGTFLGLYADASLQGGRQLSYQDVGPGAALSYMASLSDNGQYVAYVGRGNSDVFVYDLGSDSGTLSYQDSGIAPFSFCPPAYRRRRPGQPRLVSRGRDGARRHRHRAPSAAGVTACGRPPSPLSRGFRPSD